MWNSAEVTPRLALVRLGRMVGMNSREEQARRAFESAVRGYLPGVEFREVAYGMGRTLAATFLELDKVGGP